MFFSFNFVFLLSLVLRAMASSNKVDPVIAGAMDSLLSCSAIAAICAWTSIHPNVPSEARRKDEARILLDSIATFWMALLVPELILLWALRDWLAARRTARKYARYGWGTLAHGFLINMGGFALYDDVQFLCYLWDSDIRSDNNAYTVRQLEIEEMLIEHGSGQNMPILHRAESSGTGVTQETTPDGQYSCLLEYFIAERKIILNKGAIEDRSHLDEWSKILLISQTGMYLVRCIIRIIQGGPLTELDILTLALITMNFVVIFLWWHKPQGLRYPQLINLFLDRDELIPSQPTTSRASISAWLCDDFLSTYNKFGRLTLIPFAYPLFSLLGRSVDLVSNADDHLAGYLYSSKLRISSFAHCIAVYVSAVLLGVLHIIAWSIAFPTVVEGNIWRVCTIFTIVSPIAIGYLHLTFYLPGDSISRSNHQAREDSLLAWARGIIFRVLLFTLPMLYLVTKVTFIILALLALRSTNTVESS